MGGSPTKRPASLRPAALRRLVLKMAYEGQSVHIPCAFSLIEIVSVLYSKFLKIGSVERSASGDRDYLALSKGHGIMALYACLRRLGVLGQEALDQYFKDGSALRGLSESNIPGVDVTSGSMGHGLPVAAGIALGLKRRGSSRRVFCIVGDGELNEGSMWEALLFAGHHRLDNLTVIVDANGFQAMGETKSILDLEPLPRKFVDFGFAAEECGGHDVDALEAKLSALVRIPHKPQALVARTVKGKGVSFMENDNSWHYTRLTAETFGRALKELACP